jgi:hypothetical protein
VTLSVAGSDGKKTDETKPNPTAVADAREAQTSTPAAAQTSRLTANSRFENTLKF